MIRRSFSEFHSQRVIPEQQALLASGEARVSALPPIHCIYGEPDIENYHSLFSQVEKLDAELQKTVLLSRQGAAALVPGRVVVIHNAVRT